MHVRGSSITFHHVNRVIDVHDRYSVYPLAGKARRAGRAGRRSGGNNTRDRRWNRSPKPCDPCHCFRKVCRGRESYQQVPSDKWQIDGAVEGIFATTLSQLLEQSQGPNMPRIFSPNSLRQRRRRRSRIRSLGDDRTVATELLSPRLPIMTLHVQHRRKKPGGRGDRWAGLTAYENVRRRRRRSDPGGTDISADAPPKEQKT